MAQDIKVALLLDNKQFDKALTQSEKKTKQFANTSKKEVAGMTKAFGALAAAVGIKEVLKLADDFTVLNNRLKAVTNSEQEAASALKLVQQVAKSTRSDLASVASLFADITIAGEELALSQKDVAAVTQTFSQALKVSGADAGTAAGAIRQFGQALASGVLRGDEFNSINEANSKFMGELAKAVGVTRGELREMAQQGQITAKVMIDATEKMADNVERAFGKTVGTIADSFTNLRNEILSALGDIGSSSGGINTLSTAIDDLANAIKLLKPAISVLGTLLGLLGSFLVILLKFRIVTAIFKGFGDAIFGATVKTGGLTAGFATLFKGGEKATEMLAKQGAVMKTLGGLVVWFGNSIRMLGRGLALLVNPKAWGNFFKNSLNPFKKLTLSTITLKGAFKGLVKTLLAVGRRFFIFTGSKSRCWTS